MRFSCMKKKITKELKNSQQMTLDMILKVIIINFDKAKTMFFTTNAQFIYRQYSTIALVADQYFPTSISCKQLKHICSYGDIICVVV